MEMRVTDVEIKVTYLEHKLDELSEVLHQQQQKIDALEALIQGLAKRVKPFIEDENDEIRGHEKPPHY